MQKFMQKEFENDLNLARNMQPRNVLAAASSVDAKVAEPRNSLNTRSQTGSWLQRGPNIPSSRIAEKYFGYAML
jgi:hypothetical protein